MTISECYEENVVADEAKKAAQWMWDELQREGSLAQHTAVAEIAEQFGDELTYINDNGNPAIKRGVLKLFKALHEGKAQWFGRPDFYWRL